MKKLIFTALVALLFSVLSLYAQEGTLDASFGTNGIVTTDLALDSDNGESVAVQPDGKIVVGGVTVTANGEDFLLIRYNTDGTLDNSFGSYGKALAGLNGTNLLWSIVIQQDEKIVAGGYMVDSNEISHWQLVRFNINGTIDSAFGTNGIVITDFDPYQNQAYSIVIQPNGKILMSGISGIFPNSDFALAQYNSDGSLDTTFGTGGKVTTDFDEYDFANCVIINSGKIIVGGDTQGDWALAQYNPDGSLDATFGTNGKVITNWDTTYAARIWSLAVQSDGKIIAGGYSKAISGFDLIRYKPNGSIDNTFGVNGRVSTSFLYISTLRSLLIQPDGKIIAAGSTINGPTPPCTSDFAMARYNTDGELDASFGSMGRVITNFGNLTEDVGQSAILTNGAIYIAGRSDIAGTFDFALARYIGHTTSIIDIDNTSTVINIYPNPSTGKFIVEKKKMGNGVIEIYNMLGKIFFSVSTNRLTNEIDLTNAPKGIYFVKYYNGEKNYTEKIVIQ